MKYQDIERSILTTYRKNIFRPFTKAINDYCLVSDNDHICVCISGGKDSLLLAKCMQELEKHGKCKIKCEYVAMNPGYTDEMINDLKTISDELGINIQIINSDIFSRVKSSGHKSPCYVCAKMRRGCLYSIAQELGCNKIALGHHFNDVIETTMLSILYNGIYNTMLPKIDSKNYPGIQLIRPLYLVHEDDIIRFINHWDIKCIKCNCMFKSEDSKRMEIKKLIKEMKKINPYVDYNIFRSSENVEIEQIRGTIKKDM